MKKTETKYAFIYGYRFAKDFLTNLKNQHGIQIYKQALQDLARADSNNVVQPATWLSSVAMKHKKKLIAQQDESPDLTEENQLVPVNKSPTVFWTPELQAKENQVRENLGDPNHGVDKKITHLAQRFEDLAILLVRNGIATNKPKAHLMVCTKICERAKRNFINENNLLTVNYEDLFSGKF